METQVLLPSALSISIANEWSTSQIWIENGRTFNIFYSASKNDEVYVMQKLKELEPLIRDIPKNNQKCGRIYYTHSNTIIPTHTHTHTFIPIHTRANSDQKIAR